MLQYLRAVHRREEGASAVEYGLLVAAIAAVVVLIVFALGTVVHDSFQKTCTTIKDGAPIASNANCNS